MSFLDITKAILPLILIVGMLYGVLYFIRKKGISFKGNKTGSIAINVLSSKMIMPKKYISVVKVDDKLLILGVSDHSITLLKEVDQPQEADQPFAGNENKIKFLNLLKKNLGMK
jgi:flagellar protein FliO/FliZ